MSVKNPQKNEAGELIRFVTKRMEVGVARPQYPGADGEPRWAKRFYFAKMINGELARFPLSSVPADAERIADQIAAFLEDSTHTLADAKRRFNPRALARSSEFSTIGDVFEYHQDHWKVLALGKGTGADYQSAMIVMLRRVDAWRKHTEFVSWSGRRTGLDTLLAPWLETSTTALTARLAMDYQRLMVPSDLEDEEEEITQKITCDSNLRSARALFSREAMKLYKASQSIVLPDLTDFMGVSLFNAKKYFVLLDQPIIKNLFVAAPALKADDLNAYRAFLVCIQCGLRKSEAANLRMDWMVEGDSTALLVHEDGTFKPKHGHGRKVTLDPWVAAEMRAIAAPGKYFIDGTEGERTDAVFSRLNGWLRKNGVDTNKPTHELRKLWFSQKVKRESVLAAAQQGGHRDVKITQSFYADTQMPDNILPFWQEPTISALAKVIKTA